MNYLELLEHSYEQAKQLPCPPHSRLAYLGDYIFDFTTYDDDMSAALAVMALDVCAAITAKKNFDYIQDEINYKTYILMCNMPFFADRLEWGTSIRGAWWDVHDNKPIKLNTSGLYIEGKQECDWAFSPLDWMAFINCLSLFAFDELNGITNG
jgi:hypothetical protein